jgi:hypothetical protein
MHQFIEVLGRHPGTPVLLPSGELSRPLPGHFVEVLELGKDRCGLPAGELGEMIDRDEQCLTDVARVSHVQFVAERERAEQIPLFLRNRRSDNGEAPR